MSERREAFNRVHSMLRTVHVSAVLAIVLDFKERKQSARDLALEENGRQRFLVSLST